MDCLSNFASDSQMDLFNTLGNSYINGVCTMNIVETILIWAMNKFFSQERWKKVIQLFVSCYVNRYYEENITTAYIHINKCVCDSLNKEFKS